jgi:hypothetical protein
VRESNNRRPQTKPKDAHREHAGLIVMHKLSNTKIRNAKAGGPVLVGNSNSDILVV